jgi:16S rRNA (cytidine1402-2'-O)-methyltransferase
VLIVGGAAPKAPETVSPEQALELAREYRAKGLSATEAARRAAAESGAKKNEIYEISLFNK